MRRRSAGLLAVLLVVGLVTVTVVRRPAMTTLLRVVPMGPDPAAMTVDERTGRLFVMDRVDGALRMIDTTTGLVLRTIALRHSGPMAVDAVTGRLFVGGAWNGPDAYGVYNDHAIVRVVDARSGAVLRTVAMGVGGDAMAMAVDARLNRVLVGWYRAVFLLDARSGAVLRTVGVPGHATMVAADAPAERAFVVSSNDGTVSTLDIKSGTVLRIVTVGSGPSAVAADERTGHVFVANAGDGTVSVLDARQGNVIRTVTVGRVPSALTVDAREGRVFLANAGDSTVSMLDGRTGALLRTIRVGAIPVAVAVDERSGRVFVASQHLTAARSHGAGKGSVSVLDARTGAVLRSIAVGGIPTVIAIDGRAGRAFVIGDDDTGVSAPDPWSWMPSWLRQWLPWVPRRTASPTHGPATVSVIDATW